MNLSYRNPLVWAVLLMLACGPLRAQVNFFKTYSNLGQSHYTDIFGGENENIVPTPQGFVVTGATSGVNKLFLSKLNSSGVFQSGRSFDLYSSGAVAGIPFDEFPRAIKPTPDGGFVVGGTMRRYYAATTSYFYHGFLVKVDSNLNFVWGIDLDPSYTTQGHVSDIKVLNNGSFLVNLYAYGTHSSSATSSSWVEYRILVNSTGTSADRWHMGLCQGFGAIYQKPNGSVYFASQAGSCSGAGHNLCLRWSGSPGGSFLNKAYYQGMVGGAYYSALPGSIERMQNNRDFLIAGIMHDGSYNPFVMKTDSTGNPIWTKKVVITGIAATSSTLFEAHQLPNKNIVLAGDDYIVRLDSNGNVLSAGSFYDRMIDMVVRSDGQVVLLSNVTGVGTGINLLDSAGSSCAEQTPPTVSSFNLNIVAGSNNSISASLSAVNFNMVTPLSQVTSTTSNTTECETFPPCTVMADFTPSGTTLCVGTSLTVTNNSVGATSYQWYWNGSLFSTSAAPSFPMGAQGLQQIMLVAINGQCADSFVVSVNSYSPPSPSLSISGALDLCSGDTIQLHASATGGSLQWLQGGLPIAGATGGSIVIDSGGIYTVAETSAQGCTGTSSTQLAVTLRPTPTPSINVPGPAGLCPGDTLHLQASTSGGTVEWLLGGIPIPGATGLSLAVTAAGTFTIRETSGYGCVGTSTSLSVSVYPDPVAGFTFSINNGSVAFTNTSTGGGTSQWDFGDGQVSSAANPSHTYASTGAFVVCLWETSPNGCIDSTCHTVQVITVGMGLVGESAVEVYPNPAHGAVGIRLNSTREADVEVSIIDLMGKEVMRSKMSSGERHIQLRLEGICKGMYLVKFVGVGVAEAIPLLVD